ncbi:hypothetical protein F3087_23415 [Nocardia colli]|uniref:Secreted protein n=1 Tax=Nocardia colli TaxID=2545717 RepID=A0A5N0EAI4_9NOCA|nr:hypothetical protein [Nocardia colli]KAA8886437.1 hypothetical protein F3087_23415 [Nocardia colli]
MMKNALKAAASISMVLGALSALGALGAGAAQADWTSGGPFASREDCDGYRHVQGGENAKYWSCKSTADGWILEPKTTY